MLESRLLIHQLNEIEYVMTCLSSALMSNCVPPVKALDIRLCLIEAIVNGLTHGNDNDVRKDVDIRWRIDGQTFYFCVQDEGKGYHYDSAALEINDMEILLKESGKGLYLIGQVSDEIWYNEQGNQINGKISW